MTFILTSSGETRALRVKQVTNPEDAVIAFMSENTEPVEFDEILDETEMDDDTARKIIDRLIKKGLIKEG